MLCPEYIQLFIVKPLSKKLAMHLLTLPLEMSPDLITGIHGDDPITVFQELNQVVKDVIEHLESVGKTLPSIRTRPMMEVAI